MTFDELIRASGRELERLVRSSEAPDAAALPGREWRGFNVGLRLRVLGLRKFVKGFLAEPDGVVGFNRRARQNAVAEPWIPSKGWTDAGRFGFFTVGPAVASERDRRYPQSLVLDYGASDRNQRGSPTRIIRDYLVQPDPANPDLLLGKAYLALGPARVRSNFFVIERLPQQG